jgi:hypothetical protein
MQNQAIPTLLPVYQRADVAFERGEGAWLYDREGRRWLDMACGIAVTSLGHCHPHLVQTVQDQAAKLWHVSNIVRIPELERLADRLVAATFADTCFVCNSGAEALECAAAIGPGTGVAIKVEDGGYRAAAPAAVAVLAELGLLTDAARGALAAFAAPGVTGGGRRIGELRAVVRLRRER